MKTQSIKWAVTVVAFLAVTSTSRAAEIVAWGANYWGQANVPQGLASVVAIAGVGLTVWR